MAQQRRDPYAWLFFAVTLVLSSWFIDTGTNDSIVSRAALTAAIVEHGTLSIDAYHEGLGDKAIVDGHYYCDKAPLPSFVMVPLWWCAHRAGMVHPGERGLLTNGLLALGGFVSGSIPFALIITLLWLRGRRLGWSARWGSPLTLALPLFGSFLFVYSGTFYNHVPAALFILLCAWAIQDKRPVAAGLWAGAALLTDTALGILIAVIGLQLLAGARWRMAVSMGVGLVPGLCLLIGWNLAVTGEALSFPASHAANYPQMHGAVGFGAGFFHALPQLLFSPYRGLFFFMPGLIAIIFVRYREGIKPLLLDPMFLPAIALILVYSTHATWWGGWAYGPRYLCSAALLLFAFLMTHLRWAIPANALLLLCGALGCICTIAAKSTVWYSLPTEILHPVGESIFPALAAGQYTTWQVPVWFGLEPRIGVMLYVALFIAGLYALTVIDRQPTPQNA